MSVKMFRIGHGYDTHQFISGRKLILGGVEIPFEKGMRAHSDGDVIIHAICDALLGAMGLGNIGLHFPDSNAKYKNINSRELLSEVVQMLQKHEFVIGNIDVTVIAERPKLSSYIKKMCETLAEIMLISPGQINIKATTSEKMGFIGREEGIAVHVVALIESIK